MLSPFVDFASVQPFSAPPSSLPTTTQGSVTQREADLDAELREMQNGYRASGGLTTGDELACRLRGHSAQPISVLARWIVGRNLVAIHWRSQTLIPLFQFHLHDMSLRAEMQPTVPLLSAVLDEWQMARWFAQPNARLDGRSPADEMNRDPGKVLQAAMEMSASRNGAVLAH